MKKFIIKSLIYFIPFISIFGYHKYISKSFSGDIGYLGQIPFGKSYDENFEKNYLANYLVKDTLIVSYKKFHPSKTSKIFTIGDSFSEQEIFGYQNYLAHILGDSIINIKRNGSNFETAISLLNSGIIDSSNCKLLIFEKVDRDLIDALCNINLEIQYKLPQSIENKENENINNDSKLHNLCSWIRLQFGYDNPVFKHNLKQDYFSHDKFSHIIFCYKDDLYFKKTKPADIEKAKENLILFDKKISEKGIKLIFLIAADKYDVYRPFMTDDFLPIDTITDQFSTIPNVYVINTKWMFQKMLRNSEKDVYMVNNTHWSYKASEVLAKQLAHNIDSLGILK